MNPLGSLTILFKTYLQFAWATHWQFFHKIPTNMTTICLVGSFQRTHNKLSKNPLSMWLSILWSNCWVFYERTLNEWLRHIVGKFWSKLSKNPRGSFKGYLMGNLAGFFWKNSQLTYQSKWDQSGEQVLKELTTYPLGKVGANWSQTLNKLSICLPGKTPSAPV